MIATTAYAMLGVRPDATDKQVRRAFMMLARTLHPDVTDDENAAEQFKAVTAAYEAIQEDRKYHQFWQPRGEDAAGAAAGAGAGEQPVPESAPEPAPEAGASSHAAADDAERRAAEQAEASRRAAAEAAEAEAAAAAAAEAQRRADEAEQARRAAAEAAAAEERRRAEAAAEAQRRAAAEEAQRAAQAEAEAAEVAARHAADREAEARIAKLFAEAEEARRAAEAEKEARRIAEEARAAKSVDERAADVESETARLFAEAEKARRAAEELKKQSHHSDLTEKVTRGVHVAETVPEPQPAAAPERENTDSTRLVERNVRVVLSPDELVDILTPTVVTNDQPQAGGELFVDDGEGLVGQLDIPLADAVLGTSVEVTTPRGETRTVQVPACTQTDDVLVVAGQGAPDGKGGFGDLRLIARVITPRRITDPERRFFEWLSENHPGDGQTRIVPRTR